MQTEALPPIREIYDAMQENHDYEVKRCYFAGAKAQDSKKSVLKKGHFLEDAVKASFSPGPANVSNHITDWSLAGKYQPKYSERRTLFDDVQRAEKRKSQPPSNHYNVTMPWPTKVNQTKNICEKTNFVDNAEFEGSICPGPGSYLLLGHMGCKVNTTKIEPHKLVTPKEKLKEANMNTYTPIPVAFNTFQKYQTSPPKKAAKLPEEKKKKDGKENGPNKVPGPGQYQILHTWKGKDPLKEKEYSYLDRITKGSAPNVYYGGSRR